MISEDLNAVALQVHGLGCRRGNEWLFKGVSFDVHAGQLVWLRGQNGRGKTSLLRLVVGLAQPDEGLLEFKGVNSVSDRLPVVYVGHSNALKDDLTAMESLQFLLQLHGPIASEQAVVDAMRQFSVHQRRNQFVKTLSQGQRRRVSLSRLALERTIALWVLDEPFEALDTQGIDTLKSLIVTHVKRGGSVLMTSHIPIESDEVMVDVLDLDSLAVT